MAAVDSIVLDLVDFLNACPTAFHAVAEAKSRLKQAGFEQVSEREDWKLEVGHKYFFTRNHSTIIAFAIGKKWVHLVGAPQLSMHSIREMCAVDDAKHSYEHFKAYFNEFTELNAKLKVHY